MDTMIFLHNLKSIVEQEHITKMCEFISISPTVDADTVADFLVKITPVKDFELFKKIFMDSKKETTLLVESLKRLP